MYGQISDRHPILRVASRNNPSTPPGHDMKAQIQKANEDRILALKQKQADPLRKFSRRQVLVDS